SSRRRHTRSDRDWSSDVCSSDLAAGPHERRGGAAAPAFVKARSLLLLLVLAASPLRAQTRGVTLGRAPFGGLKARVTAIRFFESGGELPDRRRRIVTRSFDALTTRYINLELELEYAPASRRTEFRVECRFDGPDATPRTPVIQAVVEKGWAGSFHTAGWGARQRGAWPAGT